MPEELKPMLNTPAETDSAAAEEFKKSLIARMDRAHEAHLELNRTLTEPPEPAPHFNATTTDGEKFSNGSIKGKVVLLRFLDHMMLLLRCRSALR